MRGSVVEQALGAYLSALLRLAQAVELLDPDGPPPALPGGDLTGVHVITAEIADGAALEGEVVEAEIIEDDEPSVAPIDETDIVDAEVIEDSEMRQDGNAPFRLPSDEPGAVLLAALAGRPHVGDDSDHGLLERLAACERAIAALYSAQVEALAEFARRRATQFAGEPDPPAHAVRARKDFAAEELTARLRWTSWTAQHRLDEAERLAACLPATWTALAEGRLDYPRARRIVNGTRSLREDDAAAVDAAVADRAAGLTSAQLDELLAVEVTAVDTAAAARRTAAARKSRRVGVEPRPDGQALLVAEGPAADVLTIMTALTSAAGPPTRGDERGIDARRFDALRDWAGTALSHPIPDQRDGSGSPPWRPHVLLTVALSTVLGLDHNPGHLHGYGPLPASVCRQITAEGTLRRLLTDPVTGLVVGIDGHTYPGGLAAEPDGNDPPDDPDSPGPGGDDPPGDDGPPGDGRASDPSEAERMPCPVAATGGGRYRPGRLLDRLIRHRDTTCTAPGCRRSAMRCDLDHIRAHPFGPTCPCNLHPLCRRHHRMKHRSGATVMRLPNGDTAWTMPTGHVYTRPARPPLHRPLLAPSTRPDDATADAPRYPGYDTAAHGIAALTTTVHGTAAPRRQQDEHTHDPFAGPPPF